MKCLECETELKGRSDKKFCDDACRSAYNNRLNSDTNSYMKRVNYALRKNRRILSELNPQNDKAKTTRKKLEQMGFDFQHFTSIYVTKTGTTYYFCYEHGYLPLENDYYALVVRKEFLQ